MAAHDAPATGHGPGMRVACGGRNGPLVRMGREPFDPTALRPGEERVRRLHGEDGLSIAVGPGVVVREVDGRRVLVVPAPAQSVRLPAGFGVEVVRRADPSKPPQPAAHVLVVARGQQPTSIPLERVDRRALRVGAGVPAVDREEPELVEIPAVEAG